MAKAELVYAKKDTTKEFIAWSRWMNEAASLSGRYASQVFNDDPFGYNETASVSVLASAAACAGYVGLAEFSTAKARLDVLGHAHGRSDFWMKAEGRSWAFEFKQWAGTTPPSKRLVSYMQKAQKCAAQILENDADHSVAGLILPLCYIKKSNKGSKKENRARAAQLVADFATSCDYVWKIPSLNGKSSTFFMFNMVSK